MGSTLLRKTSWKIDQSKEKKLRPMILSLNLFNNFNWFYTMLANKYEIMPPTTRDGKD